LYSIGKLVKNNTVDTLQTPEESASENESSACLMQITHTYTGKN